MVKNDWLQSYSSQEGIEYVFYRTNARISQKGIFNNAFERIAPDMDYLNEVFLTFYPALQLHVKQLKFDSE
jgi:acyl carrier protein phosphodiesterase